MNFSTCLNDDDVANPKDGARADLSAANRPDANKTWFPPHTAHVTIPYGIESTTVTQEQNKQNHITRMS